MILMCAQVMYIPSAVVLIQGGSYSKWDDGLWDTLEIANLVLIGSAALESKSCRPAAQ